MGLRWRALTERARASLVFVPVLYVLAAGVLAFSVIRLDGRYVATLDSVPFLLGVTVDSARSILGTIAGATITVAGIVFSVTVVSVQLASSQFSPRVLRGFLRDRFQQHVIGVVVGTFTYCMFVLATTRVSGPQADTAPAPSLSVTVAIVLAVVAILAIIAFIDHSARSMQVGQIIRRITDETHALIDRATRPLDERTVVPTHDAPLPEGPSHAVRAREMGWVQQLDRPALVAALPPGSYGRLDVTVGDFVTQDIPLCTYWIREGADVDPDRVARHLREAMAVGTSRTMQEDIGFGLRQLIDIGLRALSPGVNDPTTAIEVLVHLGGVLTHLLHRQLPPRIAEGDDGQVLVAAEDADHGDHIDDAFDQMRLAAATQPAVLVVMLQVMGQLAMRVRDAELEHRLGALERQAELVLATAERADLLDHDLERVRRAARRTGLVPDERAASPRREG